jgi:hypothetical protein
LGANIFQRPQIFLFRRKGWARTFFKGRRYFSLGAKVGREHFSKAANIALQARRLGANIFHRPQTFLSRRKGGMQIFSSPLIFQSKVCKEQSKIQKAKAK